MIDIRVNNHSLDLGKVSISFELKSPLFNDKGSFSYPFTIPSTARNKKLLNFPFALHCNMSQQTVVADIFLKGIFWIRGSLIITKAEADNIKMFITIGEGNIRNKLKTTRLNEINLGGERQVVDYNGIGENDVFSKAYESIYPIQDFTLFPMFNASFYDDTDYKGQFSQVLYVNKYDKFTKMNIENNTFVPFVYLNYLINKIGDHFNTKIKSNYFTSHPELLQLVIYNNVAINSFFQNDENDFTILLNPSFNLSDHVPDITIQEFFEIISNTFGVFYFINDFSDDISLISFNDLLLRQETTALNAPLKTLTISQNTYTGYSVEFQKDSEDPVYGNNSINISKYNFIGNHLYYDSLEKIVNNCFFAEADKRYYSCNIYLNSNGGYDYLWKSIGNAFSDHIKETSNILITPQASFPNGGNNSQQKGNFGNNPSEFNKFDLRFLFFRPNTIYFSDGGNYIGPFGTSFSNRNKFDFDYYALYWHGRAGLYERFWKQVIEFHKRTREGEFLILLSPSQLKQIDFSKKYRFANATWLISEIKFQVTNDAISPSEVVAFSV